MRVVPQVTVPDGAIFTRKPSVCAGFAEGMPDAVNVEAAVPRMVRLPMCRPAQKTEPSGAVARAEPLEPDNSPPPLDEAEMTQAG